VATLKDLKKRQELVSKINRMTSATKMVSQAKMARARIEHQENQKGRSDIVSILGRIQKECALFNHQKNLSSPLFHNVPSPGAPWVVVVLSTDRGLCGHFNDLIRKKADTFLKNLYHEQTGPIHVAPIGGIQIKQYAQTSLGSFDSFADLCAHGHLLVQNLAQAFVQNHIRGAYIINQKFLNILHQEPCITQLLPLKLPAMCPVTQPGSFLSYDPCPELIFQELTNTYFASLIQALIKEHALSEHSARFLAMDSASENAKKKGEELSIQYNRLRQSKITTEILELSTAGYA